MCLHFIWKMYFWEYVLPHKDWVSEADGLLYAGSLESGGIW